MLIPHKFTKLSSIGLAAGLAALLCQAAYAQTQPRLEEVVVTGTRLMTADGFSTPVPVTVVGAEDLEAGAAVQVNDVIQNMPMISPTGQTQGIQGTVSPGQGRMNLRGLGEARTLVLVDGQRPVGIDRIGRFDTNMLPSTLVDRVEMVTGGASAAYGSDAVAGVVNIILTDSLEGFRVNAQYGISAERDARERQAALGYGTSFAGGRGHLIAGIEASNNDPTGTMYSRDWGRKEPGIVGLPANRPNDLPAFIIGERVQLSLAPYSLITGCVGGGGNLPGAACPLYGTTFNSSGQPTTFEFGPIVGTNAMIGPEGEGNGNYGYNLSSPQFMKIGGNRHAYLTRVNYDVTPETSVSAQFAGGQFQNDTMSIFWQRPNNSIRINRDNPFIPDSLAQQMDDQGVTQLLMNRLNTEAPLDSDNTTDYWMFSLAADGNLFGSWRWDAYASTSTGKHHYHTGGFVITPNYYAALHVVDGPNGPECGSLATNPNLAALRPDQWAVQLPGCVPANPFGPLSPEATAYMFQVFEERTTYDRHVVAANVAGEAMSLPAGPLAVAAGMEWRSDKLDLSVEDWVEPISQAGAWLGYNAINQSGELDVWEAYVEAGIPLISDAPFARSLDLNVAARYTDYSITGSVNTWKVGLSWEAVDDVRFRATRSQDIRAPSIQELSFQGIAGYGVRCNPLTNICATGTAQQMGNPNLSPEEASTWTAGVVLQTDWMQGVRLSLDWYDIQVDGVIGTLGLNDILRGYYLDGDQSMAQYIVFDNSEIGFAHVFLPNFNLNEQRLSGTDLEMRYSTDLVGVGLPGELTVSLLASHLYRNETLLPSGATLINARDVNPKLRTTSHITYSLDRMSVRLTARTTSGFRYRHDRVGPDADGYEACAPVNGVCTRNNTININRFPSTGYLDLSGRYLINDSTEVYGVVNNLLDRQPPMGSFTLMGFGTGGSGSYSPYDFVGRYFRVGMRMTF